MRGLYDVKSFEDEIRFMIDVLKVQLERANIMLHNLRQAEEYIVDIRKDYDNMMKAIDMNLGVLEKLMDKKALKGLR